MLAGLASRWCLPNGTWSRYSNYSLCRDVQGEGAGAEGDGPEGWSVELTYMLYQVGYALSLVALFFAVLIFVSFK